MKADFEEWHHWLEGARHPFLVLMALSYKAKSLASQMGPVLHSIPVHNHLPSWHQECQGRSSLPAVQPHHPRALNKAHFSSHYHSHSSSVEYNDIYYISQGSRTSPFRLSTREDFRAIHSPSEGSTLGSVIPAPDTLVFLPPFDCYRTDFSVTP